MTAKLSRLRAPRAALPVLVVSLAATFCASQVHAVTLPPGPVMGHPAEYVIVTPAAFAPEFQRLARWKTRYGIPSTVQTLEWIQASYPGGRDDAERVRMFLKDAHAQWDTRWVLLGGEPPFLPARRVHTSFYGGLDMVSDLYFSALAGSWDANGNGVFGEGFLDATSPGDSVDLRPDVYVGRAPVRSPGEAHSFVDKTLLVSFLPVEPRPHEVLLAADVYFPANWSPGDLITLDGADLTEDVRNIIVPHPGTVVSRLYENWDDPRWPGTPALGRASLLAALRAGTDFLVEATSGGPLTITAGPDSVPASDFAALTDAPRPAQAWLLGSQCGNFEGDCLASTWLRTSTGGAVTCVAPSSYMFISAARYYLNEFAHQVYDLGVSAVGEASARSKLPFILFSSYDGVNRMTQMEINLLGDPETRLYMAPPAPVAVEAPASIPAGGSGFEVMVSSGGAALQGASVCAVFGEEAMGLATTDAAGRAWVDLSTSHEGEVSLTVTAPDGGRLERTIPVNGALSAPRDPRITRLDVPTPNPAVAAVQLAGSSASPARLELFDVAGRRLRSFDIAEGRFSVRWDLRDERGALAPAGLYLVRLSGPGGSTSRRLLISP